MLRIARPAPVGPRLTAPCVRLASFSIPRLMSASPPVPMGTIKRQRPPRVLNATMLALLALGLDPAPVPIAIPSTTAQE